MFTDDGRCLIDAFCTKKHGGAVGGIGAASLTYSYFNDILAWGLYDCIWPNFLPDLGSDTPPDFVRPSYALSEAKHYFAYHVFLPDWWISKEHSTMHLFGFTGETYLNLYTEQPQPLQITHGLFHPTGTNQFTVTAEPGTVICLSKDNEIIGVDRSEGQPCSFVLPEMAVGEHFTVTATKQNRFRYEDEVTIIPESGPYVIVEKDGLLIENEFHVLHHGEDAHIGLIVHNYGNGLAENITLNLACDSEFIEIEQGSCQTNNLLPNQSVTLNDAFRLRVADMTPDMTEVVFSIRIDDGNFENNCHCVQHIAAPSLVIKPDFSYVNENGLFVLQMEREGFTDIHIPIANEGHFDSDPVNMHVEILAPFITIDSPTRMFNSLAKGETKDVVFRATAQNSSIEDGWLKAAVTLNDGLYQAVKDTLLPYGGFNESFVPSYYNTHDWHPSGDASWVVTDEESHKDGYSAKSGIITHNQSSSLYITLTTNDTEISFFKKTSSEADYDKLHFYIDDVEKGQWSGITPWSEERFPVTRGTHTFKWSYIKDYSVDSGDDCAWIDDMNIEPSLTSIAYSDGGLTACKNDSVHINHSYAYHFQSLEWTTEGDGMFEDCYAIQPVYLPGPNDFANDGVMLQLQVDGSISPLQLILTDEISLSGEIAGDDLIDPNETLFSHYSIEDQGGIDYVWQLVPEEAGTLFSHDHEADIVWDPHPGLTEATLSVTADASCCPTSLSKTIQFHVLSTSQCPTPSFTVFPNPTDGKVSVVLGQDLPGKTKVEDIHILGTRMASKTYQNLTKGQTISLDLQPCPPGLYIIKLCGEDGCWGQKVNVR